MIRHILQRYIAVTVIKTILLVSLILIGLETFIIFVSQIQEIGHGDFNILQSLLYVLLILPQQTYSLFPLAALLGSLMGLGFLASHSELIVMRASGVSMTQIIWAVLKAALFLVVVVTLIGEILGPISTQFAEESKASAISQGQAVKTSHGVWVRNKNEFIHIDTVQSKRLLKGISIYTFDEHHRLTSATRAKKAEFKNGHWTMFDVAKSLITFKGVSTVKFSQEPMHAKFEPDMFQVDIFDPQQLSLIGLFKFIHYRVHNGLQANGLKLVFWQRILQPIATAVMMFLAIPFIFGPLRTVTMGLRIIAGVSVGFGFYLLNQFFGPLSLVYQLKPFIAAALPPLLFLGVGFVLLKR